jgi:hypothetical protein
MNNNWKSASVVWWSEVLATVPEIPGSILGSTRFSEKKCLKRGPLSLLRITEELLQWESSGSGIENRN